MKRHNSFEKVLFTLGNFVNLLKEFDAADHKILVSKLQNYSILRKNLQWFESYVSNKKESNSQKASMTETEQK